MSANGIQRVATATIMAFLTLGLAGCGFFSSDNNAAPVDPDAPAFTSPTAVTIPENTTAVLTVAATDPQGDPVTFSISGGTDGALFSVDANSGVLTFIAAPDFENPTDADTNNVYLMNVAATDGTNATAQSIVVTVTNVAEAPAFTSAATASTPENTTAVLTVVATDPQGDPVTFSISGGADGALFSVDANSGVLTFIAAPDFENPTDADTNNIYLVNVAATDGTNAASQSIAVTVTDVAEAPAFTSAATASTPENTTAIATVAATDPQGDPVTFSISGGADGALFSVDANSGVLTFAAAPDFENPADADTNNIYLVNVVATDGTNAASQSIVVTVTDVADTGGQAPAFTSSATASIPENTTAVLTVAATDPQADPVTYGIVGGADQALFNLGANSGVLTFAAAPDFEAPADADANNVYLLNVEATDGTNATGQSISVTVTDVADTAGGAPVFTSADTISMLDSTTTVIVLAATDPDGDTVTYAITGGDDAALFNVIPANGLLRFNTLPSFGTPTDADGNNVYLLDVEATDGTNATGQSITVTIHDRTQAPTFFSTSGVVAVPENTTAVSTLHATDPQGDPVTFNIIGGDDPAQFTLDANSGVLAFITATDYENPTDVGTNNIYDIFVEATDGTNATPKSIRIVVTDVDEAPVWTSGTLPTVPENTTAVFTLSATDPQGDPVTYNITLFRTDGTLFTLDPNTGVLAFITAPDYETPLDANGDNTYIVSVEATDGTNSVHLNLAIRVTDVLGEDPNIPGLFLDTGVKQLLFTWTAATGVDRYRLLENPDGVSGFTVVAGAGNIVGTAHAVDISIVDVDWANASYMVEACDAGNTSCTLSENEISLTTANMLGAIGYFKASNTGLSDQFGFSVAISGDGTTLAVGANNEDSNATGINGDETDNSITNSGAVYLFRNVAGTWVQQAYVKASNPGSSDKFGMAVALSDDGNTLAVGTDSEDSDATGINGVQTNNNASSAGAAYLFRFDGANWAQQAYIKASNAVPGKNFGGALALSADGNTLAVGAVDESSNATGINGDETDTTAFGSGAAYLFRFDGANWAQQAYIKASNSEIGDQFGGALDLAADGNTLAVGATRESSNALGIDGSQTDNSAGSSGAAYLFRFDGANWAQQAYIKSLNSVAGHNFGGAVAVSGDGTTLAVGAVRESNPSLAAGAAYLFRFDGANWAQQAYIKASNAGTNDEFGTAVALNGDGDTLLVGAPNEDSLTSGINGNQTSNLKTNSGAAYLFRFNGSSWSQTAFMKASNSGFQDFFGSSLDVSTDGNILAVGATGEDSGATGVGGTPDTAVGSSGAAYLY